MKVGLVCPYSLTVPGGVQDQVLGLGRALRSLGVDARVLAPCDGPPPDAAVTPLGASIPTATNGSVAPIAPDPPAQLRLIRAVRDEGFDLLHLHEPCTPGATQTSLYLQLAPLVGTFHAAGHVGGYGATAFALRRFARRLERRFAVSPDARDLAHRLLGGEYVMAFNGVEINRFASVEPWPTEGPTVLFLGRHDERKGLSVLLEALNWLPADLSVWVAGEGPETESLRRRVAGDHRVSWLGRVDEAEKARRLASADVFAAPSLGGESFGIVLLESFAARTPVVASDLGAYARVAAGAAELSPPGDPVGLAAAIERVLADSSRSEQLRSLGAERARLHSMDRLAEFYCEHYTEVLADVARQRGPRRRRLLP